MPEPFKSLIHPGLIKLAAEHLQRAWPDFDRTEFLKRSLTGLDALEMKARAMQVADALEATLPADFGRAAAIIERTLGPAGDGDDLANLQSGPLGLAGWIVWPLGEFVARRGQAAPQRALSTLHALTQRFSAEFAIRPFIARHPELAFATLARWTCDPSAHVRRLVSEGSRPRLPWGMRLQALVADPSPTLPLLRALQDDSSAYVRRSVANHLNDIAKDHPQLVVAWVRDHLPGASVTRRALLRHASRSLIKQGHPAMLSAWGLGRPLRGDAALTLSAKRLSVGDTLGLVLALCSRAASSQTLEIDYAVHHVNADGERRPKLFKGWKLELAAHQAIELRKRHSLRPVTTRTYRSGRHAVDVRVNGRVVAEAEFDLRVPRPVSPGGGTNRRRRNPP